MTFLLVLVAFGFAFALILIPVAMSESRTSGVTRRVYPPGMIISPQEREHVVALLMSAHEHAKAGSIVPFRAACADHQTFDKKVIGIAREAIDVVIIERNEPVKPPPAEYVQVINGCRGPGGDGAVSLMETPAIAKYVELSHEHNSLRKEVFDCPRGESSDSAEAHYGALSDELDELWCAMDRDEKDETELRLGPLVVHSAAYDDIQCHACSVVILTRRRGSSLPWRTVRPDSHPLHGCADPAGPRFWLCQECASKALEACDHVSYEQMLEDHKVQLICELKEGRHAPPESGEHAPTESDEQRTRRIDALLVGHRRLIDVQQTQIDSLTKLDASAQATIRTTQKLVALGNKLIENQAGLIQTQTAQINGLERLVRMLGGTLPTQAQA